ncbi:phosphoribosylanthranilate isomerase [Flaviflagellibacter deserti]|uniref:N-(5'-phosphoribosyl)anthranilate isomerase n=1 Tax=Flaviflagellibacter deserti TaxID=2267266 RepID=A0ABV9Z0J2_9HYPH
MSVEVKICGLSTLKTLDAALDAGADYVGFVFFEKSPRNVEIDRATTLVAHAKGSATTVALVVDPDWPRLDEIMGKVAPDALQFHGSESPDFLRQVHARYPDTEIWKALPIASQDDLGQLALYLSLTDRILFDAKPPKGADRPGGHGRSFDWSLLRDLDPELGFMLSGGLDPDNVADAIRMTHAMAVDVSSGVESAPGVKDTDKIRAFIAAARAVRRERAL